MTINELVTQLEEMIRNGQDFDEILETGVQELHKMEPDFDWTGIYELFPDETLRLGPFVGAPTDHVFIGVGRGVCGTAVAEGRNLNIPDVRAVDNYLACSAETRSELVVLIRDGECIFAQLDIDSHRVNAFGEEQVENVQRVADVLAHAYRARQAATS
jgi:GAF domain-containing protein